MPSEKAALVIEMMRKAKSKPQQGKIDYAKRRAFVEQRHALQPTTPGVRFAPCTLNGVEAEVSLPDGQTTRDAILYIHGSGFLTGSARSSRGYASCLAAATGVDVYAVTYRMAPEEPWPAAPQDCLAVYRAILDQHPGGKVALAGGSAGANLCLVTAMQAAEKEWQRPAAMALYSPVTDITGGLPSRVRNAGRDCMILDNFDAETRRTYAPGQDPRDPRISPLYGDLSVLPPLFLTVDEGEILLDDTLLLDGYARQAGVPVELTVSKGLFHDYPSMGAELPEGAGILARVTEFFRHNGLGEPNV